MEEQGITYEDIPSQQSGEEEEEEDEDSVDTDGSDTTNSQGI
jgi:hypothetical protein